MATPEPWCPVREEPCSLCQMGVTGPRDCGLLYLLMDDPDLRAEYVRRRQRETPTVARQDSKD